MIFEIDIKSISWKIALVWIMQKQAIDNTTKPLM